MSELPSYEHWDAGRAAAWPNTRRTLICPDCSQQIGWAFQVEGTIYCASCADARWPGIVAAATPDAHARMRRVARDDRLRQNDLTGLG